MTPTQLPERGPLSRSPVGSATTPASTHPHTELASARGWSGDSSTKHGLKATLSIQDLSPGKGIITGQFHDCGSSSSIPLLMLHHKSGDLAAYRRLAVSSLSKD
jgi:hypothetical protein